MIFLYTSCLFCALCSLKLEAIIEGVKPRLSFIKNQSSFLFLLNLSGDPEKEHFTQFSGSPKARAHKCSLYLDLLSRDERERERERERDPKLAL
jgi:hypothetical protein